MSPAELAKLGKALSVDYLVLGSLRDFTLTGETKEIGISGGVSSRYSAKLNMSYSIVVVATGQEKWTANISVVLGDRDLREYDGDGERMFDAIIRKAATDMALGAIDNIYPIRVNNVRGDVVVLEMGGSLLKKGDTFEVFELGDIEKDTYFGESLDESETSVATIELDRVDSKKSYAKIVMGEIDGERVKVKGAIARRPAPDDETNAGTRYNEAPNEGVRLRGDK